MEKLLKTFKILFYENDEFLSSCIFCMHSCIAFLTSFTVADVTAAAKPIIVVLISFISTFNFFICSQ